MGAPALVQPLSAASRKVMSLQLSRTAQGPETGDHNRLNPCVALALRVGRVLVADIADRERSGNRLERLDADRDKDLARYMAAMKASDAVNSSPCRRDCALPGRYDAPPSSGRADEVAASSPFVVSARGPTLEG